MATINSKEIIEDIMAGKYPEDKPTRIVRYTNAWGQTAYGVTFGDEDIERYTTPTEFIINPVIIWNKGD